MPNNRQQEEKVYSTQQVSKLLNVARKSISNWIDQGKLKAFKTPGGFKRIRHNDLIRFINEYDMPLPPQLISSKKVLIVDDDDLALKVYQRSLRKLGKTVQVEAKNNPVEALIEIGGKKADLVIVDIMMPNMNGYEFCKRLKEHPETKDIKVIAMTASTDNRHREAILAAGADDFYHKTDDVLLLIQKVRNLLSIED
ncbi:MAG: response regulator [Thermodesulfobacteriota bacterium]|nr:response regulator [Thermodesulfobacteriota bacterium]